MTATVSRHGSFGGVTASDERLAETAKIARDVAALSSRGRREHIPAAIATDAISEDQNMVLAVNNGEYNPKP